MPPAPNRRTSYLPRRTALQIQVALAGQRRRVAVLRLIHIADTTPTPRRTSPVGRGFRGIH